MTISIGNHNHTGIILHRNHIMLSHFHRNRNRLQCEASHAQQQKQQKEQKQKKQGHPNGQQGKQSKGTEKGGQKNGDTNKDSEKKRRAAKLGSTKGQKELKDTNREEDGDPGHHYPKREQEKHTKKEGLWEEILDFSGFETFVHASSTQSSPRRRILIA